MGIVFTDHIGFMLHSFVGFPCIVEYLSYKVAQKDAAAIEMLTIMENFK